MLSNPASNGVIYGTYMLMLIIGLAIAFACAKYTKTRDFLSSNGTRKALPLALNFIASAMGTGVLTTYAQIANISGVHGLLVYAIAGALPLALFGYFGPLIMDRCPEGFVLTEWCRDRYGIVMSLYLSLFTLLTMFLYMVSELTAIDTAIGSLTNVSPTPCVIVECIVTSIYTFLGGFHVSFTTDTIQAGLVLILIVVGAIGYGTEIHIDRKIKDATPELTHANKLGWMLIYIMVVAVGTNDAFLSSFWLRAFAAKTKKDLTVACSIAAVVCASLCTLFGVPGFLAVWTGDLKIGDDEGYNAFFLLCSKMHNWVIVIILIFSVALSTCTFDSLQSATTSSVSNDIFRNKVPVIWARVLVIIIMVPSLVVAIKASANVLQIYFIADLLSAAIVPIMFLGLSSKFYFLRGLDIIVGSLAALLAIFVFGTVYYGSAKEGAKLLLVWNGVYDPNDWGGFGAFVIAPFGGIVFGLMNAALRIGILKLYSIRTGKPFTALEVPQKRAYGVKLADESDAGEELDDEATTTVDKISVGEGKSRKEALLESFI